MRALVLGAFGLFCAVLYLAVGTPLVLDGRTEPALLGLPFPLWWTAGWVVAAFGALAALHLSLGGESDE